MKKQNLIIWIGIFAVWGALAACTTPQPVPQNPPSRPAMQPTVNDASVQPQRPALSCVREGKEGEPCRFTDDECLQTCKKGYFCVENATKSNEGTCQVCLSASGNLKKGETCIKPAGLCSDPCGKELHCDEESGKCVDNR